ncbi:HDA1 complex subunit [Ophiocordyceps camponoti-floridani]|uniref:HDA1 complex subunit n=1 Tax=Ophiocordyceps camponoti-floridani TaxID=2030778 RepID=A0A8H4VGG3_9HYPO|nr:HDA1 complex subunit [Ophiocordyceps camponoti-floridani]
MRKSRRPARKQKPARKWFAIRGILEERLAGRRLEYLVDWEDDGVTGEPYEPTWESGRDVTDAAKLEWEARRAPTRTKGSKRKRAPTSTSSPSLPSDEGERPRKAPRRAPSSEEPVPSITSGPSLDSGAGFEPGQSPATHHQQRLVIEIQHPPKFDPSEYLSVSESQLSEDPSLVEPDEQSRQALTLVVATQESGYTTIPDSQEPSGLTLSSRLSIGGPLQGSLPVSREESDEAPPQSSRANDGNFITAPASPEFATQPPPTHIFALPDTSSSSGANLVAATSQAELSSQHPTGSCPLREEAHIEESGPELHDAQVQHIDTEAPRDQIDDFAAELHDAQVGESAFDPHDAQVEASGTQLHTAEVEESSAEPPDAQVEDATAAPRDEETEESGPANSHVVQAQDSKAELHDAQVVDFGPELTDADVEVDGPDSIDAQFGDVEAELPGARVEVVSRGVQTDIVAAAASPGPQDYVSQERSARLPNAQVSDNRYGLPAVGIQDIPLPSIEFDVKIEHASEPPDVNNQTFDNYRPNLPGYNWPLEPQIGDFQIFEDATPAAENAPRSHIFHRELSLDTIEDSDDELRGDQHRASTSYRPESPDYRSGPLSLRPFSLSPGLFAPSPWLLRSLPPDSNYEPRSPGSPDYRPRPYDTTSPDYLPSEPRGSQPYSPESPDLDIQDAGADLPDDAVPNHRDESQEVPLEDHHDPDVTMSDEQQDPPPANQEQGAGNAAHSTPRAARESVMQTLTSLMDRHAALLSGAPTSSALAPLPASGQLQSSPYSAILQRHMNDHPPSSVQQTTVAPADISNPSPVPLATTMSLTTLHTTDGSSQAPPPMGQGVPVEQPSSHDSTDAHLHPVQREHVVTLPLQASLRPVYDETLIGSRRVVTELSTLFNNEIWVEPTEDLVGKVDQLLDRLFNTCDSPLDITSGPIADLPSSQLVKYLRDANSKFNFTFELLQSVRKETRFLIVARSIALLRLLSHLAEALELECTCEAIGVRRSSNSASAARVTLALPGEYESGSGYDVVIGFDHSYADWRASSSLPADEADSTAKKPVMLHLVTTHSIEHILLHVPKDLGPLERKHALLSSVVRATPLISDPERGYPEPHQLAGTFADYINGSADAITCDTIPIPDGVLDVFLTPTEAGTTPQLDSRKRRLDGTADEGAKRVRLLSNGPIVGRNEPPLPDDVQTLLARVDVAKPDDVQINVSLGVLQALAEKFVECEVEAATNNADKEYEDVISRLQTQVNDHESSINKIYEAYRAALEDRSRFEDEKLKADAALEAATKAARAEVESKQRKIAKLEAEVTRLTSDPGEEESPLAKTYRLLQEAIDREKLLEKRVENARTETEFVRNRYQEASSMVSALQADISELKEQREPLERKASDNLVKIHRMQRESDTRILTQDNSRLKSQIQDRDRELERVREELRQLKNGRRETRQGSVPRSPRTGMMSPRPYGRGGYGGSGSRATSPGHDGSGMPSGAQFMNAQQPGNGRWNHLRD